MCRFIGIFCQFLDIKRTGRNMKYDHWALQFIEGRMSKQQQPHSIHLTNELRDLDLLWKLGSPWQRVQEEKQMLGKQRGVQTRLKANPFKPAIPSILLANVHSQDNKIDQIRPQRCEEWDINNNNNNNPDMAI